MAVAAEALPLVCPACRGPLLPSPDAYHCRRCRRSYPIALGIPDFRLFPDPYISIPDDHEKGRALAAEAERLTFDQLVARYWDLTPGVPPDLVRRYVRAAVEGPDRARRTLRRIAAVDDSAPRGILMDVGCGTAGFLAAAAPMFRQVVGLDIAFRWLVVAKKRVDELGLRNVRLICACAEHLPFPDRSCDVVAAEDVLDHVRDQAGFLRESARVLRRPSGVFYLSTPNRYSLGPDPHVWVWGVGFLPARFRDAYVARRRGLPYGPIRPVSHRALQRLLRGAGLRWCRMFYPDVPRNGGQLSAWVRFQLRLYGSLREAPGLHILLRLIGPGFQVVCRLAEPHRSL